MYLIYMFIYVACDDTYVFYNSFCVIELLLHVIVCIVVFA